MRLLGKRTLGSEVTAIPKLASDEALYEEAVRILRPLVNRKTMKEIVHTLRIPRANVEALFKIGRGDLLVGSGIMRRWR